MKHYRFIFVDKGTDWMNPAAGTGAYADAQAGVNLASGQASPVGSKQQAS